MTPFSTNDDIDHSSTVLLNILVIVSCIIVIKRDRTTNLVNIMFTRLKKNYVIELVQSKVFGVDSINHTLSLDRANPWYG